MRKILFFPFPSVSSVNRFVQRVFCVSGVQENSIERLSNQLVNANKFEKSMVLLLDEVRINPNVRFFHEMKRVFGYPTLKPSKPALIQF